MHDEGPNFATGSAELLKIMMLTGAIIGIISLFQTWFSMDHVMFRFDYTGYDLFLKSLSGNDGHPMGHYGYIPSVIFAVSVISVIVSVLAFTKREKSGAAAGICLGAVILISAFVYIFCRKSIIMVPDDVAYLVGGVRLIDCLGIGVHSAIFAGIFLIIGGTLVLARRKVA